MSSSTDAGDAKPSAIGTTSRWRSALVDPVNGGAAVVWVASRLAVFTAAWYASWALAGPPLVLQGPEARPGPGVSFVELWNRWDAMHYASIAGPGYGSLNFETNYAFFPGFPAVVRALSTTGLDLTASGMVVAFVAGLAAAMALARLTADIGGRPELGVLAWAVAPAALYLSAPYSEALFCAFAFWAWVCVRQGAWAWAGALGLMASITRVNGLFLGAAMVVAFLVSSHRRWSRLPFLALPFVGVAAVFTYYHALTGSWTTWSDSMRVGWGRGEMLNPYEAFRTIYEYAYTWDLAAPWVMQYRFEIIATFAIIAVGVVLLVKRWWGEAAFVLLTTGSLVTTVWGSVPRYTLVLFPIWMLVGLWMSRYRVVLVLYVSLAVPVMIVSVTLFVNGYWVS